MPRVKRGVTSRQRHKKVLKLAKGFRTSRRTNIKLAREAVMKAGQYAYRDRRNRKRVMRRLWIVRLNAAVRELGLKYSELINKMTKGKVGIDRKVLSEIAIREPETFKAIIEEINK